MTNAEILRQLMKDYGLTRKKTAVLMQLSEDAIDSWLRSSTNKSYRPMPDREITFLKCLLRPMKKKV